MKLLLTLVVLIIVAGSFYADYRWKRWIAETARAGPSGTVDEPVSVRARHNPRRSIQYDFTTESAA